ncbi:hypothetical protein BH11PLA1_BH11PLA1_11200 [soil metagenome]
MRGGDGSMGVVGVRACVGAVEGARHPEEWRAEDEGREATAFIKGGGWVGEEGGATGESVQFGGCERAVVAGWEEGSGFGGCEGDHDEREDDLEIGWCKGKKGVTTTLRAGVVAERKFYGKEA